jgi:hypothetical protein
MPSPPTARPPAWPHGLGTSTFPVEPPVSRSMRITRHGPRRTPKLSLP